MSKPFNKSLHTDIIKLRGLSAEGKKSAYRVLFEQIKKKYDLSRSAVYDELHKETPGAYKNSTRGPALVNISKRELDLITGAIIRKESTAETLRFLSKEMGYDYSRNRYARARVILQQNAAKVLNDKPKVIVERLGGGFETFDKIKKMRVNAAKLKEYEGLEIELYANDDATRKFFFILAGLDVSDPNRIIRLEHGDNTYDVSALVIQEALEHIIASAESGGKDIYTACKYDIETLLITKLKNARKGHLLSPVEFRQLVAIHRSLREQNSPAAALALDSNSAGSDSGNSGGYTLDDVCRVACHFAPATKREEVLKFLDT